MNIAVNGFNFGKLINNHNLIGLGINTLANSTGNNVIGIGDSAGNLGTSNYHNIMIGSASRRRHLQLVEVKIHLLEIMLDMLMRQEQIIYAWDLVVEKQ